MTGVVEPDTEPQELQIFALAEPEMKCFFGSRSGTGFGLGSNIDVIQK
jgi:hypothetical protein